MKIAFFETKFWEEEYLKQRLPGFEMSFSPEIISGKNLPPKDTDILCVFVGSTVTPQIIENCPNLKFIATRSTGFDHIDLPACKAKGAAVSNVPTYGENTVAEFTFALLLALSRKIYPAVKRIREEALFSCDDLQGFDLMGKTFGVIGTGHIGAYAIKIASGFGMHVAAFDPYPKPELAKLYNFIYVGLEELLKISDVISLHVPYMPATHHILNRENLKLIKPGAVLINTARGGLVETFGLVEALRSGRLAGAAMDVLEEEGFVKEEANMLLFGHPNLEQLKTVLADHELMQMPNVLITPHNAFNTKEALARILDTTVNNIRGFTGGSPINLIKD